MNIASLRPDFCSHRHALHASDVLSVGMSYRLLIALSLFVASGCGTSGPSSWADGGSVGVDAASGLDGAFARDALKPDAMPAACDPFAPRARAPEILIGPNGLEAALIERISRAKSKLYVMMYLLSRSDLIGAMVDAKRRGVDVRVVLDGAKDSNNTAKKRLKEVGAVVVDAPASFTHAHTKVVWIDGQEVIVMSGNMNSYTMTEERNYIAVDWDAGDIDQVRQLIEKDLSGGGNIDLRCSKLLVSPINSRNRLLMLINGAQQTLDLGVMYIADSSILGAVIARRKAGVAVRVLLASPSFVSENTDTARELFNSGIQVRYLYDAQLHAKLIVADGVAFVGSQNMSYTSLDKNRELGIFISSPSSVSAIMRQYTSDWASAVKAP